MSLEKERLLSLIEFAQQSAILKVSPVTDVSKHGIFHEFEHSLERIPGVHLNVGDSDEEVWLVIDRLHKSAAPTPKTNLLQAWLDLPNTPFKEPFLKQAIESNKLEEDKFAEKKSKNNTENKQALYSGPLVYLNEFEQRADLEAQFNSYFENEWSTWANEEKKRRRSINLYSKLFTLKQQLEGSIIDSDIELVWGTGLAVWDMQGTHVNYPLITQLVEINLNSKNMAIEIRPRNIDFRFEFDIYAAAGNPAISNLEKAYKDFSLKVTLTFSPFDHASFELLLQSAVRDLDSSGVYWPNQTTSDDRQLPKINEALKVTDTWVLFARPRSKNLFIQDLERFKKQLDDPSSTLKLAKAIKNLVSEPLEEHAIIKLPSFRGISMVQGNKQNSEITDLFFSMAFNEEQVRIVQMLECYDGVVVQGPPGTGKTHTIVNIISHYLALGKRVLVTSMKDPALTVLKEKLPEAIRPLAVSLLASEQEGMKQFENTVSKIAAEVQRIDRHSLLQQIEQIEKEIDLLHADLAKTDRKTLELAKNAIEPIHLNGEKIYPDLAAKELIKNAGYYEWLEDDISIHENNTPQFDDNDIERLREARDKLREDLIYLQAILPEINTLPDSQQIFNLHQDLSKYSELQKSIHDGKIPGFVNSNEETLQHATELLDNICKLLELKKHIENSGKDWINSVSKNLKKSGTEKVIQLFESLGADLQVAINQQNEFLAKPIFIPDRIELDDIVVRAIANKANGKSAFGLSGVFGKVTEKNKLKKIRILTNNPKTDEDWQYVYKYVLLQKNLRELVMRWNSIGQQIAIETFSQAESILAVKAYETFSIYCKVKESIFFEAAIVKKIQIVFPSLTHLNIVEYQEHLHQIQSALKHHLDQHKLSSAWLSKEKLQTLLSECSGKITDEFKKLVNEKLGNPIFSDTELQQQWSILVEELSRIHDLKIYFENIRDICGRINKSGAKKWTKKIESVPANIISDQILPSNWQQAWRLKLLSTYLNANDCQLELKELSKKRSQVEVNLAKAYQDIVAKRTWLKLAENATPNIRAALEAFRVAVLKIGKGTGKRAIRYRQDARNAVTRTQQAIPCWIMSHYKVSESLPSQWGYFDLVIIDEASQSDLSALPALLRAKKILIVGDDKQVSPDGIGLEEEKICNLMSRFLSTQVELYRAQMTPERSIYDLFKVVFSHGSIMLKEHFRCTAAIIEYSKREFYNHELKPIRIPKFSERLDPPLIDVFVEDGFRKADINPSEARFIVDEIKKICADPNMENRTIGVISLLSNKQALEIWQMLEKELGHELISHYKIACGDARTFQGKERDIMFLSLIVTPDSNSALGHQSFAQRFNVAASRARDRMYLVRSVELDDLSPTDKLRRNLIHHFASPFMRDEVKIKNARELCESEFEQEIYDILTERGYKISPQVKVGAFRIDMVVEGQQDARIAIECDGDRYHRLDRWEEDMNRQRMLERAGWRFWRCFASTFVKNRAQVIEDLISTLQEYKIEPIGNDVVYQNTYSESRRIQAFYEIKGARTIKSKC